MAEQEFRHELIRTIVHETKYTFVEFVKNIYDEALNGNKSNRFILRDFQNALREVSTWGEMQKKEFVEDYIKDTVGLTKTLGEFTEINRKLGKELGAISLHGFLYSCALNCARECWTKPFLFYHRVDKTEYQKNMIAIEKLVGNEIKSTIRGLPTVAAPPPEPVTVTLPEIPVPVPVPVPIAAHIPAPIVPVNPEEPKIIVVPEPVIESDSGSEMDESESESESINSFDSDNVSRSDSASERGSEKKIALPKSHRKFKANSLQAYGNYLNPLVFKPPFMRQRKQKKV